MSVAPTCCGRSDMFWDSGPACRTSCLRPLLRRERHSTCEKCPIILHDGKLFASGRTLESFNAIQRLLQARHERGAIHNADPPFLYRDAGVSWNTWVPEAWLCVRDSISECEHRGFLIAASGCLMNFLYPYFPPLYNFIEKFSCVISKFILLLVSELIYVHSQFIDDKWGVY